jgi:hypothetical protein
MQLDILNAVFNAYKGSVTQQFTNCPRFSTKEVETQPTERDFAFIEGERE